MEDEATATKSVGTILREAREAKGITIDAAEAATNIRGTFLAYLENDEYDKTPGEFFVKGAIRTYGNYLGLDGVKLVDMYKASSAGKNLHEVESHGIREARNVTMKLQLKDKRDIGSGTGSFELPSFEKLPWMQIGMGAITLALIGALYFAVPAVINWSKELSNNKQQTTIPVATVNSKQNDKEAKAPAQPLPDKLVLELAASGPCWLEVTADGKRIEETMLNAGDKKTYEAKDKLIVKYGNISAVNIKVNGKDMNTVGEHRVAIKQYLRENLNQVNPVETDKKAEQSTRATYNAPVVQRQPQAVKPPVVEPPKVQAPEQPKAAPAQPIATKDNPKVETQPRKQNPKAEAQPSKDSVKDKKKAK